MRIVASDGHSHAAEGQTSTNLFFSKPGEEGEEVGLSKLLHKGEKVEYMDEILYQTLWVMGYVNSSAGYQTCVDGIDS